MLGPAYQMFVRRWQSARYRGKLEAMTSMGQFRELMESLNEPTLRRYEEFEGIVRRREPGALLEAMGVDIKGKVILDVGPGLGTMLDSAHEQGATCEFVEYNLVFYTFNRLKGHQGYRLDARTELHKMPRRRYDVVWSKQTFVADRFLQNGLAQRVARYPKLERLLDQLEGLAKEGGTVVFCPHWLFKADGMVRNIQGVRETPLTRAMQARNYEVISDIEGHNLEPFAPVTFVKRRV